MKQLTTNRKRFTLLATVLIAIALVFSAVFSLSLSAKADETEYPDYTNWSEVLSITNPSFADSGSSTLASPNGWTGSKIGGSGSGSAVITGVMNVSSYSSNEDEYKLDVKPSTPFGKSDKNVLLINADESAVAYGYTSSSFTLDPSSYYRISAWVKTGKIGAVGGAAIALNGVKDEPIGFYAINTESLTADANSQDGWFKYTFFVATDAMESLSASLSLQLGYDETLAVGGLQTSGYAMFDNVTATKLSSKTYYESINSVPERTIVTNLNTEASYLIGGDFESGNSYDFGTNDKGNSALIEVVKKNDDSLVEYGVENAFTLPVDNGANENALIVSTYNSADEDFSTSYGSITSNAFVIDRYSYARVSAWYYAENVTGGDGVFANLLYRAQGSSAEFTEVPVTSLAVGDETYPQHNGWNEISFYIKGSDFASYDVKFELGLGTKENPASGVVLFDEVKIQKLLPAQYSSYSADGDTSVDFNSVIADNSGITNGTFDLVGSFDDYANAPYAPASWTKYEGASIGTAGYSKTAIDCDDEVSGIVAVESLRSQFPTIKSYGNALMLSSSTATAYCYQSATFTATKDKYTVLTASVYVDELNGYGASLVLKAGDVVVSTIEGIKTSGNYSFYIKGASADKTLKIEIWMGQLDRKDNSSRLTSGTFYVDEVTFGDTTEEIFNAKQDAYKSIRVSDSALGTPIATVDLASNFALFDSYDDGALKTAYSWSLTKGNGANVSYGVFDAIYGVDEYFENFDNEGKQYVFALHNKVATHSEVTLDNALSLSADSYYTLEVTLKTFIPEQYINSNSAVGGYVSLSTDDEHYVEFKDTKETVDQTVNDIFRTFTFHIKTSPSATDVKINLGLGGDGINAGCAGWIYLNDITLTSVTAADFDEAENDEFNLIVELAEEKEEDEETPEATTANDDTAWWLVPSILLAVALLLAIIAVIVRRVLRSRPKKGPKISNRSSYDRRNLATEEEDETVEVDAEEVPTTEEATEENEEEVAEEATEENEEEVAEEATEENEETTEEVTEETVEEATEEVATEETATEETATEETATEETATEETSNEQ